MIDLTALSRRLKGSKLVEHNGETHIQWWRTNYQCSLTSSFRGESPITYNDLLDKLESAGFWPSLFKTHGGYKCEVDSGYFNSVGKTRTEAIAAFFVGAMPETKDE